MDCRSVLKNLTWRDFDDMTKTVNITLWALVAGILLAGCSYQRKVYLKRTDLPEYIYTVPASDNYIGASVGVFNFREPRYAKGMGKAAAEALYHALLTHKVFAGVTYEEKELDLRMENVLDLARDKGYDLIIVGDLLYCFDGSLHLPSRVDQRLRVLDTKKNTILWHAKAVDIGPNMPYSDYYVAQGRGASAPTAETLFARNAGKFSKMLVSRPPRAIGAAAKAGQGSEGLTNANDGLETEPWTKNRRLEFRLEEDRKRPFRLRTEPHESMSADKTAPASP